MSLSIGCLGRKTDKLEAANELQIRGYDSLILIEEVRTSAWLKTDCSFPSYARFTFYADNVSANKTHKIAVCLGFFSNQLIDIKP